MYMSKRMLMAVVARKLKKLRIMSVRAQLGNEWKKPSCGIAAKQPNSTISKFDLCYGIAAKQPNSTISKQQGTESKKPKIGIAPKQPNSTTSKCVRVEQETEWKKPKKGIPTNQPKCTIFKCGRKQGNSWKRCKMPRVQQMWKDKQYKINKIIGIPPNRPTSALFFREIEKLRRDEYFKNRNN